MRIVAFSVLALGFGTMGIQLSGCSNSASDCSATLTCGSGGSVAGTPSGGNGGNDGGTGPTSGSSTGGTQNAGGSAGEGGADSDCKGEVADDPTCWTTNQFGVFVSGDAGNDETGNGTKEAPYKSIGKGIDAAAGKNVYVCRGEAESYEEQIIIAPSADGTKLYGGFDCTDWNHSKTRNVAVHSSEPVALRIKDLDLGVTIENLTFVAADGNADDESSYGAFITDSKDVVLRRVEIVAGAGADGAAGADGTKGTDGAEAGAAPAGSLACAATAIAGEWMIESSCGSQGGAGAKGIKSDANAANGNPGIPTQNVDPLADINNGGVGEVAALTNFDGKPGAAGIPGAVGAGALAFGPITASGYAVASGNDGLPGFPGQGGGGGGASKGNAQCVGASGGAGGMAGCGGTQGKGGSGGGASIGLFSWNSDVVIEGSKITSGTGGAGGNGGKGGAGGPGADGGSGGAADVGQGIKTGGRGGAGGSGGNGGSGSGGTGGPSLALAFKGAKPVYDVTDTILVAGPSGAKGLGAQVLSAKAPDGVEGPSLTEFAIP